MSYNLWGAGLNDGTNITETLKVLLEVDADIIGVQETRGEGGGADCFPVGDSVAPALAEAMGFYVYDQIDYNAATWANAIISRYPIGESTPNDLGVPIVVDGRTVWAFNIHLTDYPYQPYQLLKIRYGQAPFIDTEEEAIDWADRTRRPGMELLMADLASIPQDDTAFVFGDFNEPSGLDWTEAAAAVS